MGHLLNFEDDFTRTDVSEFIGSVPKRFLVAVRSSFLDVEIKLVQGLLSFLRLTNMTLGSVYFSLTSALVALSLKLLHKAWAQLFSLNDHALAIALGASLDVVRVVGPRASAVGANRRSGVLHVHVLPFV